MGLRDRFQNLKDSVGQWVDSAGGSSLDSKIEKNLVEMESGSEIERTAAVKALIIQAQTDDKWADPIINSFIRVLPNQLASPQEAIIDGLLELRKVKSTREEEIFEAIQETLDSPYPSVRGKVVEIWTRFSLKSDSQMSSKIAVLFEMLSDDDKDVRYQTQESLSEILHTVPKVALPELKKAIADDDLSLIHI